MSALLRSSKRAKILFGTLAVLAVIALAWRDRVANAYRSTSVQTAIRRGEFAQALRLLGQFPAAAQDNSHWHFLRAKAERRSGNVQAAEASLKRASELGWNEQEIARQRLLLKAQSNILEVERELQEKIAAGGSDEEAEEAYEAMARGYLSALRFKESHECLNFWSDWQPDNPIPHLWKGMLYDRAENPDLAAQEYETALRCDPANLEARSKLAKIRLDQLQIEQAAELFAECIKEANEPQESLLGLADCKRRLGAHAEAKSLLHDALLLELEPYQAAQALGSLAKLAQEEGENEKAVHMFATSIALNPNDFSNRLAFAAALMQAGQVQLAEAERKTARAMSERHGRLENLIRQVTHRPLDADLRCEAGRILLEQGMPAAGVMWLNTALQIDPQHRATHQALAEYYRQIGQAEQAQKHRAVAAGPSESAKPTGTVQ